VLDLLGADTSSARNFLHHDDAACTVPGYFCSDIIICPQFPPMTCCNSGTLRYLIGIYLTTRLTAFATLDLSLDIPIWNEKCSSAVIRLTLTCTHSVDPTVGHDIVF
jgi:hypothetical protein